MMAPAFWPSLSPLILATVWRRDRVTGLPLVPTWAPRGDPEVSRKLLYVFDKRSGGLIHVVELDGHSAATPMTYLHTGGGSSS